MQKTSAIPHIVNQIVIKDIFIQIAHNSKITPKPSIVKPLLSKNYLYTLGQFKDDQIQTHTHNDMGGAGSYYVQVNTTIGGWYYNENRNSPIATGRHGGVTRGKRKGVNFIIKA